MIDAVRPLCQSTSNPDHSQGRLFCGSLCATANTAWARILGQMTIRRFRRGAILLILLAFMFPTYTAFAKPRPIRRIQIPSIGVDLPIVVAPFRRTTWDFSRIGKQAAY